MEFKNESLIDVMDSIVSSMRTTLSYSSTLNGNITNLEVKNSLKELEIVYINSKPYIIFDVNEKRFSIKADVTGFSTLTTGAPYFLYGHILEIADILSKKKQGSGAFKYTNYPLVILQLDITGNYDPKFKAFDYTNVKMFICNLTDPTFRAPERKTHNFEKILYPIYENLIKKISSNKEIVSTNSNFIKHKKTDRFFWGVQLNQNSTKNILNDYLDAIEIDFNSIKVKQLKCK